MDFEWDEAKAESNQQSHGVSFTEAMTVFADPLSLTGYDPDHSDHEDRYITMGLSTENRLLIVSYTDRVRTFESSAPDKRLVQNAEITKMATSLSDSGSDDLRPEYDFRSMRGVVRGKYAARYRERLRVVRLADDVAEAFADEAAVNEALREYLRDHPTEQSPA